MLLKTELVFSLRPFTALDGRVRTARNGRRRHATAVDGRNALT